MEIRNVPSGAIKIGHTYRHNLGDVKALAESIRKEGLLQPIGVTRDFELVFGKRRFAACRMILHWKEIPCRIVDTASILTAQYVENEMRKDLLPSERDSLRRALEDESGKREGKGTDLESSVSQGEKVGAGRAQVVQEKRESDAEGQAASVTAHGVIQFRPGEKTRELTARMAGFDSAAEARRVRKVMEQGAPELIQAMDGKKVRISVAAKLADLPKPEQVRVLAAGKEAIAAALGFRPRGNSAKGSNGHGELARPSDEVVRASGPDRPTMTTGPVSLKAKAAALHKMEKDLGRSLKQLDYLAEIFGKDLCYQTIDRAIRIAFLQVDAWRRTQLPKEYWDYSRRAWVSAKPK
jgi:ParB-like chromosome segregation protein Spo0J